MVCLHQATIYIFISMLISFSSAVVSDYLYFDKQIANNTVCNFKIHDIENVKNQFTQLSILDDVQMIRFNIDIQNNSASTNKDYFNSLNGLYSNGLERWVWMNKKYSYLLTYSPDFEIITLNRSTSIQRNIYIPVEAFTNNNETNESYYDICTESLFAVIFEEILNQTNQKPEWLFCHRYFKGQEWKLGFLYKATGAWIGYDFECFNSKCQNTNCAQSIKKGKVNFIINISILVVVCYFPLLLLLLPKRTVKSSDKLISYSMGDHPFSLSRYLLRLNSTKKCNVSGRLRNFSNLTYFSEHEERDTIFDDCFPEISLISFLFLIVMIVFTIQRVYFPKLIPDFNKYVDVYHPCITYNLLSHCDSEKHDLDLIIAIISSFLAPTYFLILSLIYIHSDDYYISLNGDMKKKMDNASTNITGISTSLNRNTNITLLPQALSVNDYPERSNITNNESPLTTFHSTFNFLNPISTNDASKNNTIQCNGYTKLAMKFLDRISIFLSSEIWKKLFTPPLYPESKFSNLELLITVPLNVVLYVTLLLVPIIPFFFDIIFVFPIRFIWNCRDLDFFNQKKPLIVICVLFYIVVLTIFFLFLASPYFSYILQSIIRTIIYTFFVAGPLFTTYSYDLLALVLAISLYVIKYVVNFYQIYKNLLDKLLKIQTESIKKQKTDQNPNCIIPIPKDEDDTEPKITVTESKDEDKTDENAQTANVTENIQPYIPVDVFKRIVEKYLPLRTQLMMLSLKILVTSLFLYVAIDTLSKVGKEDMFSSPIPALVATSLPIIAEKLCSPNDPQKEIDLQENRIREDYLNFFRDCRSNAETENSKFELSFWIIFFPVIYTILRPVMFLLETLFPTYQNTDGNDEDTHITPTHNENGSETTPLLHGNETC